MNRIAVKGSLVLAIAVATAAAAAFVPHSEAPTVEPDRAEPEAPVTVTSSPACEGAWPYVEAECLHRTEDGVGGAGVRIIRPDLAPASFETVDSESVSGT